MEPITTQQRGNPAPFAILLAMTLAAAACTAAALVTSQRHALAACQDGAAVPWSQFALAYAGFGTAVLAVTLYAVARRRARGPGGTWSTAVAVGRAGLVTAVCAGVVVLAGALAVFSDHQQASMAEESSKPNVLVACKID